MTHEFELVGSDEITLLSSINAHIKDNVLGIGRTTILNHESIRKDT